MVQGTSHGWLRVLSADELLRHLRAHDALDATWRQSRLAAAVWQRDLLDAVHRYAEFVQLMPASESHHHAHAGGLLAHTLEMLLAAMTWRNGHFLPSGAQIEQIDAERDVWTYVVFFAALLHDIAKPMTDLRIEWRATHLSDPLRWTPLAGSLVQLTRHRIQPEYRVDFTPKSLRDYGAHGRLALTLLGQIAPPSALSFLASTPQAMDALTQYLSGQDKSSLVARIVSRADQASTSKALLAGNRARFDTATSVPLIELLMGALKAMLANSSALPLNRSGAAGWVYDGAIWFVAKRLADGVRAWLRQHAPEESLPGENKNDRLFDTWQEYGCIDLNPQTGQAVWYVQVHGGAPQAQDGQEAAASYSHRLTMLRFPLGKLFDDEASYPPAMAGRIEVRDRLSKDDADQALSTAEAEPIVAPMTSTPAAVTPVHSEAAASSSADKPKAATDDKGAGLRAPSFNSPKTAAGISGKSPKNAAGSALRSQVQPTRTSSTPSKKTASMAGQAYRSTPETLIVGSTDGFDADDGLLDDGDDACHATTKDTGAIGKAPKNAAKTQRQSSAEASPLPGAHQVAANQPLVMPMFGASQHATSNEPVPVALAPNLPPVPQAATRHTEPSDAAMAFMRWLQHGLAGRGIKYNEAGAPVHFTAEGMALVSPLIFKLHVSETQPDANADEIGLQVQREVIRAGWHLSVNAKGDGKRNILRYDVLGRGGASVGRISAVVLTQPDRWVVPVPPTNPVLRLA